MNQTRFYVSAVKMFCVMILCASAVFAQIEKADARESERSFDVVLQTVVASNAVGGKTEIPAALSPVIKKLKMTYPLSSYELTSTYLQRVANTGSVEFKGTSSKTVDERYAPIFSEWNLGQLLSSPDAGGRNLIQVRNFRFGQRIPVRVAAQKDEQSAPYFYESIGLTMQKLNLTESVPTVVGSMTTSKPDEVMFLVLTVKAAEN